MDQPAPLDSRAIVCSTCETPQTETLKLMTCDQCKSVQYCDKKCQKKHWKEHKKDCKYLLAKISARARNEKLYEACKKGVLAEVCTALEVDGGVDVNYRCEGGATPLYWASMNGHVEVVRHLLSVKGIQVNQARDNGVTALFMASQEGHLDIVRLLTDAGAN